MSKKISIIIPHYNGIDILRDCLQSLYKNSFTDFETILIDNGSTDGSQKYVKETFPQVELIENEKNLGYAGACNQGMELSKSEYILLLNNDTVLPENFLFEMIAAIEDDKAIGMVQPKIISIQDKRFFDYSGGAGGEMDIFGYPFARGRIFDTVEMDKAQYANLGSKVFWTSGCALLVRKSVIDEIGLLDEDFFAHQEEIDLNWRAQLAGYKNVVTYKTHIYHYSGYTLRSDNQRKMYLNHRNNLIMMIKNYSLPSLFFFFPPRILFEMVTVIADAAMWEGKRARAVLLALYFLLTNPLFIWKKRHSAQKLRKVSDRAILKNMYPGSIVIDHFLRKLSPYACIKRFR
ncbi:MAG: glycosyltransferase family 2 protein [Calditrichaeota bacterium]|nr:MAG: glycosyltransferase family 2 protein [Calditrichota bacterium]MBL1207581.1 glycosyltransferase family 2 protein [Calditrichota bacterium]NOG47413.1 glycosyltransferase family 2 protein [Calditrichota bacterium]